MNMEALMTSYEAADYLDLRLAALREQMNEAEMKAAMVPVWLVKVVEPGSDEVYTVRINAADAPKDTDLDALLFEPVNVDCRGLAAKGFIRNGQSSGSIEADTITFQGASIKPLSKDRIRAFNTERKRQALEASKRRDVQRKAIDALKQQIEARLAADKAKSSK